MSLVYYLLLFIFGLIVGSFLNVVSLRYEPGSSVFSFDVLKGRSRCPHCDKTLRWFELIPLVSFFIQRGRCRGCGHKISWQYPVVEFLSGLIFSVVPFFLVNFYDVFSSPLDKRVFFVLAGLWILVFLVWLLISVIDIRHYLVPNELNITLGVLGVFVVLLKMRVAEFVLPFHNSFLKHYTLMFSPTQTIWVNHLLGAFFGALFFVVLILLSKGKAMGWGDVKLALVSGLVVGWPEIALSLMLAFIFGGILGAVLLITGNKSLKDKLPFAPFMIGSMVLTIFFGYGIIQGYLSLFGI
ncbi:MAG TPA: prepilin peptidase [Candidatus Paceibacterota bacterium]|nr:prepilin peptidase [Candidatus Paceibacterota bacterium]